LKVNRTPVDLICRHAVLPGIENREELPHAGREPEFLPPRRAADQAVVANNQIATDRDPCRQTIDDKEILEPFWPFSAPPPNTRSVSSAAFGIIDLRFFGCLTVEETAAAMRISPATVKRE
jgi:hypothetical protein